ncbi:hypothetical protein RND81_11G021700 [Saponaria officinalis]|uniref:Uncharacterized protein n=1 Tax=Saponaria officinalis TaxID=3572 RepID=A0AAW1HG61_SAPOF
MENFTGSLSNLEIFPTTLDWKATFVQPLLFENKENVSCIEQECWCLFIYEGNPYIPYGCQAVEECKKCKSRCALQNNPKSQRFYYCKKHLLLRRGPFLGFIAGLGFVLLVLGSYWLYRFVKRRREIKQKAKHFKRNGGLLLKQQMSVVETIKI